MSCKGKPTSLTVGIESAALGNYVRAVHVVTSVDGEKQTDAVFRASQGPVFPREVVIDAKKSSANVAVRIEGFAGEDPSQPAVVVRTAETTLAASAARKLMRLQLEPACVTVPPPGGFVGPTCSAPGQTCLNGACGSDVVAPARFEDYAPDWARKTPDACRPANAGAPVVIVGNGQTSYLPLKPGQMLQAQAGPQGGHHIWIAVRMRNMKQSGSTTTLTATQPGSTVAVTPFSVVFTFQPDEGGFCKLYGLRFQLDANGVDYKQFLGKPLDVTVTVHDALGATGVATARLNIDTTILPL
jgi:hypothetical protein